MWCYTSGAAGSSHPHDKSYYVTDSDLRVQLPGFTLPPTVWTVRRNIAGTVWYTHNATGLKTHIQPKPAAFPVSTAGKLELGWHERRTAEGQTFWFNSSTGASSWTKPVVGGGLPSGWKEMCTPDLRPFYVNEALSLSTWDRPGALPTQAQTTTKAVAAVPAGKPGATRSVSGSKVPGAKTLAVAAGGGAGLLTATGKMFGKLSKSKNLKMVSKLVKLADGEFEFGDDDDGDDDDDDDDDDDGGDDEAEEEAEAEAVTAEEPTAPEDTSAGTYQAPQDQYGYAGDQSTVAQDPVVQQPYPPMYEQPPVMPPQEQPVPFQQEYAPQPQMYEQPPQIYEQQPLQQEYPPQPQVYEQPPVMPPEQPIPQAYPPQPPVYEQPVFMAAEQPVQEVCPPVQPVYEQPPIMPQEQLVQQPYPPQPQLPEQFVPVQPEQVIQQSFPPVCEQPTETFQQPFAYDPVLAPQQDPSQVLGYTETAPSEPIAPVQPPPTGFEDTSVVQQGYPPPVPAEPVFPPVCQPLGTQPPGTVPPPVLDVAPPAPPSGPAEEPFYDLTSMSGFPGGMGDMGSLTGPGQDASGTVPSFVFEPILAGEPMVSPPTEQNGVIYSPTYV